jgi:5-formyltetrahydrofolate cyclo-ligase
MCAMSSQAPPASTNARARLRRRLRAARRAIPAAARIAAAQSLAARLLALPFAPTTGPVAGYWAMDGEIALHAWQLALPDAVTYCLPVLHAEGRLRFAPWRPGCPLKANAHGIPEPDVPAGELLLPAQMRMVVTPLVGFDALGHRLGMGAAWYDRSFAFRQQSCAPPWLVGAAFAQQQVESLDIEAWDVALDAICTEQATHLVNGAAFA